MQASLPTDDGFAPGPCPVKSGENFRVFRAFRGFNVRVDLTPYRSFMVELAAASGDFIRPFFGRPDLAVETKADQSPVTAADRGAEELMRTRIAKRHPTHGIIGEEFGGERADAEWVWMLDPIDGTKSFITGVPLWGTLIALLHRGQPVLGCINQPVLGPRSIAAPCVAVRSSASRTQPC